MSFISRLFGSNEPPPRAPEPGLAERLAKLEQEAEDAPHGYKGTPLNKAGDVALRDGDQARALAYYGRAIDSFMEDQQREAARGVANKIIRVHPKAVRTLCTLTWLDLAARHMATALLHLRDYVEATGRTEFQELAADQIWAMARIVPQVEFLAAAADALDGLDQAERAEEVRGWVKSEGSPDVIHGGDELAEACLEAASHSNQRTSDTERVGE